MPCPSEHPHIPPSAYALRWLRACAVLATVGVGVGMLLWGPVVALLCVASGTLFVWLLRVCALPQQMSDLPGLCFSSTVVTSSLLTSGGAVGLRALLELSVPVATLLAMTVVATSPPLIDRLLPAVRRRVESDVPPLPATQRAIWEASTAVLSSTSSVQDRLELVEARQHMLDALFDDKRYQSPRLS